MSSEERRKQVNPFTASITRQLDPQCSDVAGIGQDGELVVAADPELLQENEKTRSQQMKELRRRLNRLESERANMQHKFK